MAVIDLTGIPIAEAEPMFRSFGGVVGSALGGAALRINRLGDRWAWKFTTAPMRMSGGGQRWAGLLTAARRDGARLKVSQPDVTIGAPGAATVRTATSGGRGVPVQGMTGGYVARAGQWLSIERAAGDRFLDLITADAAANGTGQATLTIANLLRAPLAVGDVVNLIDPKIEGWITGFDSWPVNRARMTQFQFTIEEAA